MIQTILLFVELVLLFILTQLHSRSLYTILYLIFRNKRVVTTILTFIYLPGTAVHEFAHLIVAEILRVPTGELSFTPQFETTADGKEEIKAGSLQIKQTDPIRRFLIGIAPVIFGLLALVGIILLFQRFWPQAEITTKIIMIAAFGYLLYTVSNNMFSSRVDMEGSQYLIPIILILTVTLYILGIRVNLTGQLLIVITKIISSLVSALGIVLGVNCVLLFFTHVVLVGLQKLLGIKIHYR